MSSPPGEPRRIGYLYLLPALLVYGAFLLYPLLRAVHLSLFEWNGITLARFVGLSNYLDVVRDAGLRAAFGHALVLIVFYAVFPVLIGLALASVLQRAGFAGSSSSGPSCSFRRWSRWSSWPLPGATSTLPTVR